MLWELGIRVLVYVRCAVIAGLSWVIESLIRGVNVSRHHVYINNR